MLFSSCSAPSLVFFGHCEVDDISMNSEEVTNSYRCLFHHTTFFKSPGLSPSIPPPFPYKHTYKLSDRKTITSFCEKCFGATGTRAYFFTFSMTLISVLIEQKV